MGRLQLELANHVNVGAQLQAADEREVQGFMAVQADVHLSFHRPDSRYECFHIDRLDFPSASARVSVNLADQKAKRHVAKVSLIDWISDTRPQGPPKFVEPTWPCIVYVRLQAQLLTKSQKLTSICITGMPSCLYSVCRTLQALLLGMSSVTYICV